MQIILVPGFWLDASSWDPVVGPLTAAGHSVMPITPVGLAPDHPAPAEVTLRDRVDQVVALVDAAADPVVLVGHSGGAAVIHAVVDARPERVVRAVYVDAVPLRAGGVINARLPVVDGLIPLPDWTVFDDTELTDLTDELRARFRAVAIPEPAQVARQPQELHDERRYDVPVTVISCGYPSAQLREIIADPEHPWYSYVSEVARIHDVTWVDLPTGHWPQLTKPAELTEALVTAVAG